MEERLRIKVAVFLILEKDGKYLFSQRKNTGYRDGFYTVPSGHVDPGELPVAAMVREAGEEIHISLDQKDLDFVHVLFQQDSYIDFYFKARVWSGEPINGEPDKCSDLRWATLDELGELVVPKVAHALLAIERGVLYSEIDKEEPLSLFAEEGERR